MPWFKVDDAFHSHPKAMKAGTAALGLWARCGSWAAQQLTDGYVPTDLALLYGTKTMARSLVNAGLWHEVDGGYQFHEWSPINPTRTEVEALRENKRKAGSAGGRASGRVRAKGKQELSTDEAECLPSGSEVPNTTPSPYLNQKEEPPQPPRRGGKRTPKQTTPPPDLLPITDEMRAWADQHAPDVRLTVETARMLDWARGKGESKQDWVATWRNWMGRAQDNLRPQQASRPEVPVSQRWMQVNQ